MGVEDVNGLGMIALLPPTPCFTPGFTSNSTFANLNTSTISSLEQSFFRPHLHETSLSSSKFGMPIGHPGDIVYPDSKRLLSSLHGVSSRKSSGKKDSRNSSTASLPRHNYKSSRSSTDNQQTSNKRKSRSRSRRNKTKITPTSDNVNDMRIILKKLRLTHLVEVFEEQEIDATVLHTLDDKDLTDIGVDNEDEREKILHFINKYLKD